MNGFAITKTPIKFTVDSSVRISFDLPYSYFTKLNEIFTVPCSVFNRLTNGIDAEVTLDNEENDFEFVDLNVADDTSTKKKQKLSSITKNVHVPSSNAVDVTFKVRPRKVGTTSLKVSVKTPNSIDCETKTISVQCDPTIDYVNKLVKAVFIDLSNQTAFNELKVAIDIPKDAFISKDTEVTCTGDLFATTINNLNKLVELPIGFGEQHMINLVPSSVVLNYLKKTNRLTDEIGKKPTKIIKNAYEHLMSAHKRYDGSFGTFGKSEDFSNTWLTASVAKYFRQAQPHIKIKSDEIDNALEWLEKTQRSDGSFSENGYIMAKQVQGEVENNIVLTAHVLSAFLEKKVIPSHNLFLLLEN